MRRNQWLASVGITGWNGSESPAGLRRNTQLVRLRRENKQLRLERDILSKAAAWFARETGTLPSGSSGS